MFFTDGVKVFASVKIWSTGTMLEVPVAFLSGASMVVKMPEETGSVTEMNTVGQESSWLTTAIVAGVTIGTTKS